MPTTTADADVTAADASMTAPDTTTAMAPPPLSRTPPSPPPAKRRRGSSPAAAGVTVKLAMAAEAAVTPAAARRQPSTRAREARLRARFPSAGGGAVPPPLPLSPPGGRAGTAEGGNTKKGAPSPPPLPLETHGVAVAEVAAAAASVVAAVGAAGGGAGSGEAATTSGVTSVVSPRSAAAAWETPVAASSAAAAGTASPPGIRVYRPDPVGAAAGDGKGSPPPAPPERPRANLATIARLVASATRIVVVAGAGISVSAGLPDFRSPNGLYAALGASGADPAAVFHIDAFREDPAPFFAAAARLVAPEVAVVPTATHAFLRELSDRGVLRRVYTQNIDGLEAAAGVVGSAVVPVHGTIATATCTRCGVTVEGGAIAPVVRSGRVPRCTACAGGAPRAPRRRPPRPRPRRRGGGGRRRPVYVSDDSDGSGDGSDGTAVGVMKPDIVLFGEPLPPAVATCVTADVRAGAVDLVLVVGTSLAVAPISTLPARFPADVPRVLLNRTPVMPPGGAFDIVALGDCDTIVGALRRELGWGGAGGGCPAAAGTTAMTRTADTSVPQAESGVMVMVEAPPTGDGRR